MTSEERLELLLDIIADELIQSQYVDLDNVKNAQKFIRNGQLEQGSGGGVLALFQKDIEANKDDLLITSTDQNGEPIPTIQTFANNVDFDTLEITIGQGLTINLADGGEYVDNPEITEYLYTENNPLNVSQFIPLEQKQSIVDVERANEYLDTNIFELLPTGDTRQARIIRFFQELNTLLPPPIEDDQWDTDNDGSVDRLIDGTWSGATAYSQDNSISYAQDNFDSNIDEEDGFIHRLKDTANDTNSSRTIEDIYNTVRPYLRDILEDTPGLEGLPKYENQSSGYLKFRNLNQGIIIRNTNQEFIQGLDPSNPTWLTNAYAGLLNTYQSDSAPFNNTTNYILNNAGTGFTITMWVRFLDKVSQGTLFNYGNPSKVENPFGFKLETYVINKDDQSAALDNRYDSDGNQITTNTFGGFVDSSNEEGENYYRDVLNLFQNTNSERFVRLQVREFGQDVDAQNYDRGFRSSELGNPGLGKFTWNAPELGGLGTDDLRLLNNANIPENFNEWYFICASYNPTIIEPDDNDYPDENIASNPLYWLNHINPTTGDFVTNSGFGNKCKVEIISRSDLLRARGFDT